MLQNDKIQLYENQPIRTAWDEENEEWYFSIVDVVSVLSDSKDANAYWRKLKQRMKEEGNETVTNCHGLKMKAIDGKRRMTDVANTEQENGGHPFISVRNIVNGYIDFSSARYISDEDYADAIKKCHPEKGDMLYSKGGTTGIAKLIDIDEEFANWVHVAVLKFDKGGILY